MTNGSSDTQIGTTMNSMNSTRRCLLCSEAIGKKNRTHLCAVHRWENRETLYDIGILKRPRVPGRKQTYSDEVILMAIAGGADTLLDIQTVVGMGARSRGSYVSKRIQALERAGYVAITKSPLEKKWRITLR